jgi:hypothetical protein
MNRGQEVEDGKMDDVYMKRYALREGVKVEVEEFRLEKSLEKAPLAGGEQTQVGEREAVFEVM